MFSRPPASFLWGARVGLRHTADIGRAGAPCRTGAELQACEMPYMRPLPASVLGVVGLVVDDCHGQGGQNHYRD